MLWVQKVPYREKFVFWVWFRVVFWNVKNGVGNCGWNECLRLRVIDPNRIRVWVGHPTGLVWWWTTNTSSSVIWLWIQMGSWDGSRIRCPGRSLLGVRREMAYLLGEDPDGIRYCRGCLGFHGSSRTFMEFTGCGIWVGSIQPSPEKPLLFLRVRFRIRWDFRDAA